MKYFWLCFNKKKPSFFMLTSALRTVTLSIYIYFLPFIQGSGDAEEYMMMAKDYIEKLKTFAMEMNKFGQPTDSVISSLELYQDQLRGVHMAISGTALRRRSTRKSSGGWEEAPRSYQDAIAWIHQQMAGTNSDTYKALQLSQNQKPQTKPKSPAPEKDLSCLQKKMSNLRIGQLQELIQILQQITNEIMWVNSKEEEELMFDWGDKNVEQYIPKKQESYSKLMSALEVKEKELHKLKAKVKTLLNNNHPGSDKIEAYMDTLQTQWSWLLQITKCIDTHLKENAAYSQFFREANDTYKNLQKEHETIRKIFTCDKNTPLEDLQELLKGLERERDNIMENKRQVKHLTAKSKSIVRLKPRNPEERNSSGIIVKALTDFREDQKTILKDNEAILKDNSQRSKWLVTGPGGIDMLIPSVCLIVPPPNPLSVSLANKNEQYFDSIMSIWNQLYINVKSLISWHYCLREINYVNSLTISMLSEMRPEEYRQIMKKLETFYEEFKISSHGSEMFVEEDKKSIENQVTVAQAHYDKLVVQLPTYSEYLKNCAVESITFKQDFYGISFLLYGSLPFFFRLQALRVMLESVARAEDIVKVHEARLTEKETTSLSPAEVGAYIETLKNMKAELMQKQDVLTSMESELSKASHWNSQMGGSFHRCDLMLSKFTEQVGLLSDRWRRIQKQIDIRLQDLQLYLPQLQHYQQVYTSFTEWIEATRSIFISFLSVVSIFCWFFKVLNTEIKAKRETLDSVLQNINTCGNTIKDYETDLASYTSGLETLLNVPIKRTMLQSPSMDLNKEAIYLQTRYTELLILSGDYYKFLGQLEKNMEELKVLEEMEARNAKNKSLEEAVAQFKLQLSQSQEQLLSVEEIKQKTVMQCSATKDSLDSTQDELAKLKSEVQRLEYKLDDERRKAKLAEEGYNRQKNEWESVLNQRQKELDTVCRSKKDVENSLANKEHEIQQLLQKLANESTRLMDLQTEMSKVRSNFSMEINSLKLSYESQIQISRTDIQRLSAQRDENTAELQMQYERMETERRNLEDELRRLRTFISETEEQKKKAEEESCNQRAMLIEDGHRRRELESQMELLMKQRDEERNQYREELAEIIKTLEEKNGQLVYVTHSLEEETRRRKTSEEAQVVLEQSLAQLQMELNSSSEAATQLRECEEQLLQSRFQLEREKKERCRMEQNMSRLQGRIKDLQGVRDSLESQVENLRKTYQEELGKRRQVEAELEKTTLTMTEYTNTITVLRQSQEQASIAESRGEKECIQLKEKLEKTLRLNQSFLDQNTQLGAELKTIQQQLLQEQSRAKEANMTNESLYKTIEEKNKALSENSSELKRLKELIETQTKEELRMKKELRAVRQDKEELLKSKKGIDDELSSQITALELQLQASECSNAEHRNLVSELSSEREKLKLEAEKIQKQVAESLQSKYSEIVSEKDSLSLKLQRFEFDKEQMLRLQEELNHMKHSHELELRNKQRLQEDIERGKRDLNFWKDQCDSKQSLIRQYDTDKDILEKDKKSLKSEIERLMKEHRELEEKYKSRLSVLQKQLHDGTIVRQTMETELKQTREPPTPDASSVVFDGVRKPVTAKQLLDSGVLDKPTYNHLLKGHKTVPEVSIFLKGTGSIAGVKVGSSEKMSISEAKKQMLMPLESADLLLEAQAATGHIIDPITNQKLTVEEACARGVVDRGIRDKLLAAEAAAVGFKDPHTGKSLSVFEAMKKALIDKKTAVCLLQAQESAGGILDPNLSVFLSKETALKCCLLDQDLVHALTQNPQCYIDPDTEHRVSYGALKKKCPIESRTGLVLLPLAEKKDPSKLMFDGVRKTVSAQKLFECGILDKPTFEKLIKGQKTVPEVSVDKKLFLKGTESIAGVTVGSLGKMSISEAKKKMQMLPESADLLLEAQAATGHIIDPITNQKWTVEEACARGVVDRSIRDKLLAAESAAVGFKDPHTGKSLSVFEAMKKAIIDKKTAVRLLQAQESAGGILDPNLSIFLPIETALKHNLLDQDLVYALKQNPECYIDPETEHSASYGSLKKKCPTEPRTGLMLLSLAEKKDPSKMMFDGLRKPVSAQQLLDCGVLDQSTFNMLIKGEKTIPEVSADKKVNLKGTGSIAGKRSSSSVVAEKCSDSLKQESHVSITLSPPLEPVGEVEPVGAIFDTEALEKISITEALNRGLVDSITAQRLLEAQACTGGIVNPTDGKRVSIQEASQMGLIANDMVTKLKPAQKAYFGFEDLKTKKKLSAALAIKEMWLPYEAGQRFLEFQVATGGLYDPEKGCRRSIEDALKMDWLDQRTAQKLQDVKNHTKNLTCPKSKLRISYKEILDNCLVEEGTGVKMLQASSISSRGISSPYNVASAPGSKTGSRSGSQRGSRRSSLDLGSSLTQYNLTTFTSFSSTR
uniref:Desmoplakin a n=1 Tax=Poecilia mexicana TaxID=48701 RepID=A0A3B3WG93_9TELE